MACTTSIIDEVVPLQAEAPTQETTDGVVGAVSVPITTGKKKKKPQKKAIAEASLPSETSPVNAKQKLKDKMESLAQLRQNRDLLALGLSNTHDDGEPLPDAERWRMSQTFKGITALPNVPRAMRQELTERYERATAKDDECVIKKQASATVSDALTGETRKQLTLHNLKPPDETANVPGEGITLASLVGQAKQKPKIKPPHKKKRDPTKTPKNR